MAKVFRELHPMRGDSKWVSLGEMLEHDVDSALDYHAGQIESMKSEFARLRAWFSHTLNVLTEEQQVEIANRMGIDVKDGVEGETG